MIRLESNSRDVVVGLRRSVAGERVDEYFAIGVEDFRLGDEADVFALGVDDGQVPGLGIVENVHDFLHRHVVDNARGGRDHEA